MPDLPRSPSRTSSKAIEAHRKRGQGREFYILGAMSSDALDLFANWIYSGNIPFKRTDKKPSGHTCHDHWDYFETICIQAWERSLQFETPARNSSVYEAERTELNAAIGAACLDDRTSHQCGGVPKRHLMSLINLYFLSITFDITTLLADVMQAIFICIRVLGELPDWKIANEASSKTYANGKATEKSNKLCSFFKDLYWGNWKQSMVSEMQEQVGDDVHPRFAAAILSRTSNELENTKQSVDALKRERDAYRDEVDELKKALLESEKKIDSLT